MPETLPMKICTQCSSGSNRIIKRKVCYSCSKGLDEANCCKFCQITEKSGFTCTHCKKLKCFNDHFGFYCFSCRGNCCSDCQRKFDPYCKSCYSPVCLDFMEKEKKCSQPYFKRVFCLKMKHFFTQESPNWISLKEKSNNNPSNVYQLVYGHDDHANCMVNKVEHKLECISCFKIKENLRKFSGKSILCDVEIISQQCEYH